MPLLSLCSYPGCRHPVPRGEKYCDKHKGAGTRREQLQKKERWERRFRKKGSSAARGYGARWRRLRERFLSEHPLCAECLKQGRAVPATDVDHIRPHKGNEDLMWDEGTFRPSATPATVGRLRQRMAVLEISRLLQGGKNPAGLNLRRNQKSND